jgi:hypothetical protein
MRLPNPFRRRKPVQPIVTKQPVVYSPPAELPAPVAHAIPTLEEPPLPPMPVPYTEGMPAVEGEIMTKRPGGIRKAKRPEWNPNQNAGRKGRVVRRMPPDLQKIKEKQEGEAEDG